MSSPGKREAEAGSCVPSSVLAYRTCFVVINSGLQAPQGQAMGKRRRAGSLGTDSMLLFNPNGRTHIEHGSHLCPLRKFFKNINILKIKHLNKIYFAKKFNKAIRYPCCLSLDIRTF